MINSFCVYFLRRKPITYMSCLKMSLKHLSKGSPWPVLQQDKLRLYSMHFCPFAQRTRLVLAHKKIAHELINVNLKYKADWLLARNPLGLVPVLEYNNHIVSDSLVCDDFLEEMYPQNPLYPDDSFLKARQRTIMLQFESVTEALNGVKSRYHEKKEKSLKKFHKTIGMFENMLHDQYFGGDKPGMVDFHMWPWYERLPALETMSGVSILPADQYPKLTAWMKSMLKVPAVKEIWIPDDLHMQFFVSFATGTPNYDAAFQANL